MKFQIKHTKDYLRAEESRIYKMIDNHKQAVECLSNDLNWLQKCREEINKANKLLRNKIHKEINK